MSDDIPMVDLMRFDALPLESDGVSRLIHEYLVERGIDHRLASGVLHRLDGRGPRTWTLRGTPPLLTVRAKATVGHMWIVLAPDRYLDLRATMWFGGDAPHGIFNPAKYPAFSYQSLRQWRS